MRNYSTMHWFLWEAIRDQAYDMYSRKLIGDELMDEVMFISLHTSELGNFGTKLRLMACEVEEKLKPFEGEWNRLLQEEDLARGDES